MGLEDSYTSKDHDLNDLWKHVTSTQTEIGDLKSSVASINSELSGIRNSITDLSAILQRVATPKSVNWGWVMSGVLLLGIFISLYVNPIQRVATENEMKIQGLSEVWRDEAIRVREDLSSIQEWKRIQEKYFINRPGENK